MGRFPTFLDPYWQRLLNDYEFDCFHLLEKVLANVEEKKLTDELLKEWDEFHSQILRISGMAEDFIAKNGANASSSEITRHITGVKLALLQLPNFSGNVLEWPAFHDAFVALALSGSRAK